MFDFNKPSTSKEDSKCNKSPNLFCFLCTVFISAKSKSYPLNETNRTLYSNCYRTRVEQNGADKFYSSKVFCSSCFHNMKAHIKSEKTKPLKYLSPAIWNQPNHSFKKHEDSCFVCLASQIQGIRFQVSYKWPDNCQHNVIQPILNVVADIESSFSAPKKARIEPLSSSSESDSENDQDYSSHPESNPNNFIPYDQAALNQLVKDLGLTKDQAMILESSMLKHNVLKTDSRKCRRRSQFLSNDQA